MSNFIEKIFRLDQRILKKYIKQAEQVMALEDQMKALSDDELRAKTPYFKDRLAKGETLEDIKIEAFAVCRETARRVLHQFPFKVQIIGSLVLNDGDVAEMKTGEGKTLTCTMAVYLNALEGKGVHVVTVNEYLAQRDADWMGQIYRFLGLTVGVNLHSLTNDEKRKAHLCDITYTINSELGFDYLRDNMATTASQRVLRRFLNFAVVDEADSILIDESRTPLIISGGAKASASQYTVADRFVKMLKKDKDFEIDVKTKSVNLTDSGNDKAEKLFGIKNLYNPEYADLVHRIHQALKANYIMTRDIEYLVDKDHEIQLIDQFTGRVLKGREYSDGLQQAIQAKEGVKIKEETVTMATITYQNFFRLFKKIGGMTGTAKTEEEEFRKIYNMKVVVIPTNKPIQRIDATDYVFVHKKEKIIALVKEVKERHEKGQPVLIGTPSVEASEEVAKYLTQAGLTFEMLNAKNHAKEAEIVAKAGEKGQITLATNMAGRGTDIKLTEETRALGGLCVFGLERHESRRIDNQLRGRSGRQGDPGFSRFYVSLEDELMIRFASDKLMAIFEKNDDGNPIESKMLTNAITSAQKRIEGQNFDIRKNLLDYDDVLSKQRHIMYKKRDSIIYADDITDLLLDTFNDCGLALAKRAVDENSENKLVSGEKLVKILCPRFLPEGIINAPSYDETTPEEIGDDLSEVLLSFYTQKKKEWNPELANTIERNMILRIIDKNWTQQIDNMNRFRESVSLRSYGQINPLQDYVNEGWGMFREMLETISLEAVLNLLNVKVQPKTEVKKNEFTINVQPTQENKESVAPTMENAKPIVEGDAAKENIKVESTANEGVDLTKPNLNISHIDEGKEAAREFSQDDIHTN